MQKLSSGKYFSRPLDKYYIHGEQHTAFVTADLKFWFWFRYKAHNSDMSDRESFDALALFSDKEINTYDLKIENVPQKMHVSAI